MNCDRCGTKMRKTHTYLVCETCGSRIKRGSQDPKFVEKLKKTPDHSSAVCSVCGETFYNEGRSIRIQQHLKTGKWVCVHCAIDESYKPEPTCPECGHKAHKPGKCKGKIYREQWGSEEGLDDCFPCDCQYITADPHPEPFKRYMKYEVLKLDDIGKYLTPDQKTTLASIIHSIQEGRRKDGKIPCNSYVVVKEGLPYTEQVWKLIEEYETNTKPEQERQVSRDFSTIEHEAEMPLPLEKANELLDLMCKGNMEGLEPTEVTKLISLWYQWYVGQQQTHDQKVWREAVKEFVEKVIKKFTAVPHPYVDKTKTSKVQRIAWVTATYEQIEDCAEDIRAMAEGGR